MCSNSKKDNHIFMYTKIIYISIMYYILINRLMYKYLGFCLIINVSRSFPEKGFLKTRQYTMHC